MSADHLSSDPCCKRPSIANMDYVKHSPESDPEPRVNRVCMRCWTHWFGPTDAVEKFTKREWDAQLEAA